MKVLVAFECSGRVRSAFAALGHEAYSADLKPAEDGSPMHLQTDFRWALVSRKFDLLIAHPPCPRLCNSGVRWLYEKPEYGREMVLAAKLFREVLDADVPRICVENPVMHKHAKRAGKIPQQTQVIQPWQFWAGEPGKGETKATCLWLKNLPKLVPSTPLETGRVPAVHRMAPGPNRSTDRARTYEGIALQMAEQWGSL